MNNQVPIRVVTKICEKPRIWKSKLPNIKEWNLGRELLKTIQSSLMNVSGQNIRTVYNQLQHYCWNLENHWAKRGQFNINEKSLGKKDHVSTSKIFHVCACMPRHCYITISYLVSALASLGYYSNCISNITSICSLFSCWVITTQYEFVPCKLLWVCAHYYSLLKWYYYLCTINELGPLM